MTRPKLRPPPPPRNWRELANCLDTDPEAFYPTDRAGVDRAIQVCLNCDVMEACLDDAVARGEKHAVRGGRRFGPIRAETVDGEQDSDLAERYTDGVNETAPAVLPTPLTRGLTPNEEGL